MIRFFWFCCLILLSPIDLIAIPILEQNYAGVALKNDIKMWIDKDQECPNFHCPDISELSITRIFDKQFHSFQAIDLSATLLNITTPIYITWKLRYDGPRRTMVLAYPLPHADQVALYTRSAATQNFVFQGQSGDSIDASGQSVIPYRYPAFMLDIGGDTPEVEVLLRLRCPTAMRHDYRLWDRSDFEQRKSVEMPLVSVCFGIVLFIVLQTFLMYFNTFKIIYAYYFFYISCLCIVLLSYTGLVGIYFTGPFKLYFMNYSMIACGSLINAFSLPYTYEYFNIKAKSAFYFKYGYTALSIVFCLASFINYDFFANYNPHLSSVPGILLLAIGIKGSYERYVPGYYFLAGWIFLAIGPILIALEVEGLIANKTLLIEHALLIGSTAEALFLSFGLANIAGRQQKLARREISGLNDELIAINLNLEHKIQEKTTNVRALMDHLPIGVFTISDGINRMIDQEKSAALNKMFQMSDQEHLTLDSLLLEKSNLDEDKKSILKSILACCIGENILAFEMNRDNLPPEIMLSNGLQDKIFELDWSTILDVETLAVAKILVSCRDVTTYRRFETEARLQSASMAKVIELIAINPQIFAQFHDSAKIILDEIRRICRADVKTKKNLGLRLVLINLHTLKGSSRTLGLKILSSHLHDSEEILVQMQNSKSEDFKLIMEEINKVQQVFEEYADISKNKLNRSENSADFALINRRYIAELADQLLESRFQENQNLTPLLSAAYMPALNLVEEWKKSLARLAKDLSKHSPLLVASGFDDVYFTQESYLLLASAFVHIIRNAMDHGLETVQERVENGKNPQGTFSITGKLIDNNFVLRVADDGRGLAIDRILRRAVQKEYVSADIQLTVSEIAEFIFEPSLSTVEVISEISGRGIGLAAVRDFLRQLGGSISIEVEESASKFHPFNFRLEIPGHHIRHCLRIKNDHLSPKAS